MAQTVQPCRLIVVESARKQLRLPGRGGGLEALQLLENGDQSGVAGQLRPGRHVLPAQEEAHEVLGCDWLEGLAARALRVAVHAGEQTPGDPLRLACASAVAALHGEPFV